MNESRKPHGAGRSTFDLIDTDRFFEVLKVRKSMVLLDLGAGSGDYTIPLAEATGPEGRVFAVDAWEEGLARVRQRASGRHLRNISTLVADVNKHIPVDDGTDVENLLTPFGFRTDSVSDMGEYHYLFIASPPG